MNNSFVKLLLTLILISTFPSAFSQEVEWKHYEYPDINLQFDLPADFVFEYPEEGGLSFIGYNNWIKFTFKRIDKAITGDEQRRSEFYNQFGYDGDYSGDGSFMSGTTANGYYLAGSVGVDLDTNQETLLMMLSDPKNNTLNFLISTTYGGETNTDSIAYKQADRIIQNFRPIVK